MPDEITVEVETTDETDAPETDTSTTETTAEASAVDSAVASGAAAGAALNAAEDADESASEAEQHSRNASAEAEYIVRQQAEVQNSINELRGLIGEFASATAGVVRGMQEANQPVADALEEPDSIVVEEPPQTSHFLTRKLWGGNK